MKTEHVNRVFIPFVVYACVVCSIFLVSCREINKNFGRGLRYKNGGEYFGSNPSMSPDGNKIVFGSIRYGVGDICTVNIDGSSWKRLTDTPEYEGEPKFSPDGNKIVFISERDDGNTGHIYLMDVDGLNQTRLTNTEYYDSNPSFSPDGKKIAFNRQYGSHNNEIFIMNIDGTDQQRLTNTNLSEGEPSFTLNGKDITYPILNIMDENRNVEIWTLNIINLNTNRLIEMPNDSSLLSISLDGKKIVFLSSKGTDYAKDQYTRIEIWIMNKDKSDQRQLTYTKNYKSGPAFTPDGKKILFP